MAKIAQDSMITINNSSVKLQHSLWDSISELLKRGMDTLVTWQRREQQRRHLRELNPELLQDMGFSDDDVAQEVRKPFWKS